jgi:hypothetical protein
MESGSDKNNLSLEPSLALAWQSAWKGFKGWWIPLCVISFFLLMTQSWIPNKIVKGLPELTVFEYPLQELRLLEVSSALNQSSLDMQLVSQQVDEAMDRVVVYFMSDEVLKQLLSLFYKIVVVFVLASFLAIFIHLVLILFSRVACDDSTGLVLRERFRVAFGKAPKLFLSYLTLGVIKVVPWFFLIVPGVVVYIRLYFTGFIILEESANPFKASQRSWQLTRGHFGIILLVFLLTVLLDFVGVVTAGVGLIPGTSVKYTLRASMYNQLLELDLRERG